MMNFSLHSFTAALRLLSQEVYVTSNRSRVMVVSDSDRERATENLKFIAKKCHELLLPSADHRLERCFDALSASSPRTNGDLHQSLVTLYEAIEDDIKTEYFYHYRRDRGLLFLRVPGDWHQTLAKFESAKNEIDAGIDCYALEHNEACGFHMMRVAELGMRALAKERGVTFPRHPLEWAEWGNVIEGIEFKAKAATSGMTRGPAKDAALRALSRSCARSKKPEIT
jgi:hypothetical protein